MNIVILEDEYRAANRLKTLIAKLSPEMIVIKSFESVRESVEYFKSNNDFSLIFADIQLADGLSFEIFRQIKVHCPIIFTTAYDQYAIEAFKTNGIDYLLKPIEEERLQQSLNKLKAIQQPVEANQIANLLNAISKPSYKNRFMIKVGDKIKSIETNKIHAFYSMEKASFLFTEDQRSYVIDFSLDQLENLVSPTDFFRINRKYLISHKSCSDIHAWTNSRLRIKIAGIEEDLIVARERVNDFKDWLDQ